MKFVYDDGGRKAAGFRGTVGDCVCRAIAIATPMPYKDAYKLINDFAADEKYRRGKLGMMVAMGRGSNARTGVHKATKKEVLSYLGWTWHPTMRVGQGCKVHLREGELPAGRLIVQVSKHLCAVIDGVIYDNHNPSRNGTRCVYGYWIKNG
jgi:hypothetical protein